MTVEKEDSSTTRACDYLQSMSRLSEEAKTHLEQALQADEPSEKDFHIRNVLQADFGPDVDFDD
ncbi:hypothetical protein [Natrialba swarupiae]|uniref:Uncharacterized protein n=1 Tax=Natrialba swarupiae TaxID=2448032 RepID=A0A5D5AKR0_9EURY|nr:hypothetical protein [Natrialba swarupiae]TYT61764.1 hypothetical protein FYC77_12125 [Natrialba swarupiae]